MCSLRLQPLARPLKKVLPVFLYFVSQTPDSLSSLSLSSLPSASARETMRNSFNAAAYKFKQRVYADLSAVIWSRYRRHRQRITSTRWTLLDSSRIGLRGRNGVVNW